MIAQKALSALSHTCYLPLRLLSVESGKNSKTASAKPVKKEEEADTFEKIEAQRKKEKRDLIINQKLAYHAGPTVFFKHRTIHLCTCSLSKSGPLCDRAHLRVEHYTPRKYRVGDLDAKEFPEMLLCQCGKSRKHPLCDEQTCLVKGSENASK